MKCLLDTNICIALLKKSDDVLFSRVKKSQPSDLLLCAMVKAELLYGARKSQNIEKNLSLLEKFFSQFSSVSFDDRAAEYYGTMRTILEKSGTPIGNADLIIASIALANNLAVATRNRKEFIRVPGLRTLDW